MTSETYILVVEDEPIVAKNIQSRLQKLGYKAPTIALSGEEAVQKAAKFRPDLVLMDIKLEGGIDGVEAARQINISDDIPIIYLSAYADDNTIDRAKNTKPFGYLLKPFEVKELHSTIEMALYKHSMEKKLKESADRFRNLYLKSPLGYQSLNEDGYITEVNPAWCSLLGYSREEAINQWFGDFLSPDYHDRFREYFSRYKEAGEIYGEQFEIVRKDGNRILVEINGKISYSNEGDFKQTHCILNDITERIRAEKALEFSSSVMQQVSDAIIVTSLDFKITHINDAVKKLYGYSEEELIGKSPDILNAEKIVKKIQENIYKTVSAGKVWTGKHSNKRKDGSTFICEFKISPMYDKNNQIYSYIAIQRDITERENAKEALNQANLQLKATLDALPDILFEVDRNGVIYNFHATYPEFLYASPDKFLGKPVSEILPQDAVNIIMNAIKQAVETGRHIGAVYPLRTETGLYWFELSIAAKGNPKKPEGRLIALSRNITDRVQAEKALQKSEEQYRLLAENITDVIWLIDNKLNITYVSPSIEKMIGYSPDEIMNIKWDKLLSASSMKSAEKIAADEQNLEITGKTHSLNTIQANEFELISKDGALIWIECQSTFMRDSNGQLTGALGVARNINQRKWAEKQQDILIMKLQNALDRIKTLSGIIPICSSCNKIRNDDGSWEDIGEYVKTHSDAEFTHGLCPQCASKLYPNFYSDDKDNKSKPEE
ncbi:MAG: PAS domain S-box protein [candidate division Zixibacteria bacterium]|nr:PAS domain S-box protein [candidate division Zixibacteria bacterium]